MTTGASSWAALVQCHGTQIPSYYARKLQSNFVSTISSTGTSIRHPHRHKQKSPAAEHSAFMHYIIVSE